jgi:hypothetical protein
VNEAILLDRPRFRISPGLSGSGGKGGGTRAFGVPGDTE